jgi:hypothetical protein
MLAIISFFLKYFSRELACRSHSPNKSCQINQWEPTTVTFPQSCEDDVSSRHTRQGRDVEAKENWIYCFVL